jgi:hypothetical protein
MKYSMALMGIVVACCCSLCSMAQIDEHGPVDRSKKAKNEKEEEKGKFKDKLTFGGNIGAFFGTNTFINVNPLVGYKVTEKWVAGLGVNYIYYNNIGFQGSLLGKSIWSRYYLLENIFAHTEFEAIRYTQSSLAELNKRNVNVALVGLGYQSNYFGISVMYDLIQDPYSPYSSPLIRVGGMFGIGN